MNAVDSLRYFVPELILVAGAFGVLVADLFSKNKNWLAGLSLITLAAACFFAKAPSQPYPLFFGYFTLDTLTHFFRATALGIVAVTILASTVYKPIASSHKGEFYALFLFMAFGLILMAASTNLLMIFLSIEFVSILSYLLVGFTKKDGRAKEAAIKYLLFGSIASGMMLYGMSILFGLTGSLELTTISSKITPWSESAVVVFAFLLVATGIGFKISMAPFHMWAPDVYEGAPTPVTAFLTVGPKALGFAVLIRVLTLLAPAFDWKPVFMLLCILTMTIGNVIAISQSNIKRLLAYSSIAQAGYILMGIVVFSETGILAVLIYLAAYALTNLGAFVAVITASHSLESDDLQSYAGLSKRAPFLSACITVFLLSLAGIPPLAGFIGKLFVFSAAIESGLILLAVAAAINSAIAAYYYFKVIRFMYLAPASKVDKLAYPAPLLAALVILLAGTVLFGTFPGPWIDWIKSAIPA